VASKEAKRRSREARLADQARYDEVTRQLKERIERGLAEIQRKKERESS
jgi:hypothetical protein